MTGPALDFRLLFHSVPGCYLVLDRSLKIVAASDRYLEATMTVREEIVGRAVFDVFPENPDDTGATGRSHLADSFARILAGGPAETMPTIKFDIRRPDADGGDYEVRYWQPHNSPVPGLDGEVAFIINHVEDVTEAMRLKALGERQERAISERDDQLEAAQRIALMGSWEYRPREGVFVVSDGFRRIFGIRDELPVRLVDFLALVHPHDRGMVKESIAEAVEGRLISPVEYRIVRPDGAQRVIQGRRELVRDGEGVAGIRSVAQDVTEQRMMENERERLLAKVAALARTDALTGLPNRRAWDEELRREAARAERHGHGYTVAIVDLDHFKAYNDRFGHPAGDELLRTIGTRWRTALRATDIVARYGGEEFALLLPQCPPREALNLTERLRAGVPAAQTLSGGVAVWDRGESVEALMGRADAALYAAKKAGRNRVLTA